MVALSDRSQLELARRNNALSRQSTGIDATDLGQIGEDGLEGNSTMAYASSGVNQSDQPLLLHHVGSWQQCEVCGPCVSEL